MEGTAGQRSSRLLACARKCSVKHMVRACSTNQPVLRLSMGSLALITATSWAPGCPSELLGQGGGGRLWLGWWVKQGITESKKRATKDISYVFCLVGDEGGDWWIWQKDGEDNDVRLHSHKKVIEGEHAVNTDLIFCCTHMMKRTVTASKLW